MRPLGSLRAHGKDFGGGFIGRRLWPAVTPRSVGPFVCFEHFGPAPATPDDNQDARAHSHIGLSTVTCLFEGANLQGAIPHRGAHTGERIAGSPNRGTGAASRA